MDEIRKRGQVPYGELEGGVDTFTNWAFGYSVRVRSSIFHGPTVPHHILFARTGFGSIKVGSILHRMTEMKAEDGDDLI